jgi:hypothetical protein
MKEKTLLIQRNKNFLDSTPSTEVIYNQSKERIILSQYYQNQEVIYNIYNDSDKDSKGCCIK